MLFTGVSTVFFNINPLIKIDGYYALTSVLEMPELREESLRYIGTWLQRNVLRLSVDVPPATRRKRRIYWIYGTLALAYQLVLMRFIGGLFFNLYDRFFPDAAGVLLALTLYQIFKKRVRLGVRTARLFYLDKKELIMSARSRRALAVAGGILALLLVLPMARRTIRSEAVLRPAGVHPHRRSRRRRRRTRVRLGRRQRRGGRRAPAHRQSGGAGRIRAILRRERADGGPRERRAAGRRRLGRRRSRRAAHGGGRRAREGRHGAESALDQEPDRGPRADGTARRSRRRFRHGGPPARSRSADCSKLVAELPVSERLLDDLCRGRARPGPARAAPDRGRSAARSSASRRRRSTNPSPRAGFTIRPRPSTRPDRFVALTVFDNADGALRPGDLARAKIYSARASVLSRGWRVLRRWLQTIVW